ncbi:hypothetical protein CLOM621_06959 [Clostridium sp. M62/1]|nr:hypothetical protein CLOM621_06959 [Clostridium sp. M62/1]
MGEKAGRQENSVKEEMLGHRKGSETEIERKMAVFEKSWHGYCSIDRRKRYLKPDNFWRGSLMGGQ